METNGNDDYEEIVSHDVGLQEDCPPCSKQTKVGQFFGLIQLVMVARAGAAASGPDPPPNLGERSRYKVFIFVPSAFSEEDVTRLRGLYAATGDRCRLHHIGDGTDDKWAVIAGLGEGTVVCRSLPYFVKEVLKIEERLLLYSTIQAK